MALSDMLTNSYDCRVQPASVILCSVNSLEGEFAPHMLVSYSDWHSDECSGRGSDFHSTETNSVIQDWTVINKAAHISSQWRVAVS